MIDEGLDNARDRRNEIRRMTDHSESPEEVSMIGSESRKRTGGRRHVDSIELAETLTARERRTEERMNPIDDGGVGEKEEVRQDKRSVASNAERSELRDSERTHSDAVCSSKGNRGSPRSSAQ
jgi:hypothetical protein